MWYKTASLFLVVVMLVGLYSVLWGPVRDWAASFHPARTLAVSASGDVDVVPDIATLSFSVVSEGRDTTVIANENNTKINNAIKLVKEKGVAAEDITTQQYNLSPVYSQPAGNGSGIFVQSIEGYRLTQSVEVTIRDFDSISDILAQLPGIGINRINSLSFGVDDPESHIASAREEALSKAKDKAHIIADQGGVRLGRVVNISEYSAPSPYYAADTKYGLGGDSGIAAPRIEPGTQELSVSVSVVYEIR